MGPSYGPWTQGIARLPHEYTSYTAEQWMELVKKLSLVEHTPGGNPNDKKPWTVPEKDLLMVDFVQTPRCVTPVELMNKTGLVRLGQLIKQHRIYLAELIALCQHVVVLECSQLEDLLTFLGTKGGMLVDTAGLSNEPLSKGQLMAVFVGLLVCVRDTSNVDLLVRMNCRSLSTISNMQMTLRSMYLICLNSYSGRWKLELFNNDMDRFTALRLAEINAEEVVMLRREAAIVLGKNLSKMTDSRYSQHVHRSNFRNEQSRDKLTDNYFKHGLHDRSAGKMDFDYVSTSRPCMHSAVPMSDLALNDVLMSRNVQVAIDVTTYQYYQHKIDLNTYISALSYALILISDLS